MKNPLLETLELLIDNISPEEWDRLPAYVVQKVTNDFNAAKDAEESNV